jgi:predicted nucleotidyltransferase
VVVYGSQSSKSLIAPTPESDIDFLIIYKKNFNPTRLNKLIDIEFKKEKIRYDCSWYEENDYLSIIRQGIDYLFWINIFNTGDILYTDDEYLNCIKKELSTLNPYIALTPSLCSRYNEIFESTMDILRDLHTILSYIIITEYWISNNEVLDYWDLVKMSKQLTELKNSNLSLFSEIDRAYQELKYTQLDSEKCMYVLELSTKTIKNIIK